MWVRDERSAQQPRQSRLRDLNNEAEAQQPVQESQPAESMQQPSAFDEYPAAPQPVRPMRGQRVFGDEDDIPEAPAQPARRSYNNDVPAFLRRNNKK